MNTKSKSKKKKIAFGWYGGKFSHLKWILPLLPECAHFCEPFGGSAAVLLNRDPSPVETYNDLDGELVNFFRVLRNQKDELIYAIGMTPFSRKEFEISIKTNFEDPEITDLEKARRFFIKARQVRTGLAQTASIGRWANCLKTSRAGMSGAVSRWLGSVEGLEDIASRLIRVQIENDDALAVIKRYDSDETLFYCDPPYVHDSRGDKNAYKFEMLDVDHIHMINMLKNVKGKVAISGYRGDLYDQLLKGWNMHTGPTKKALSVKDFRTEILWTNY